MKKLDKYNVGVAEENILEFWRENEIFEKSVENRSGKKEFIWFDGPPFANGLPHFGHTLVTSIKDSVGRYKTMKGFYMPRRLGWDCHGLPVEYEVEKNIGITTKKQITEMGIEKFNKLCRESIFKYKEDWENYLERLGRFADKKNYYATLEPGYMESVWWVFKQLYDKELVYKGFKCIAICPRCETPLASHEVSQGYKDTEDYSLFVLFESVEEDNTYFLAWTTTPWTLPSNTALAISDKINYVKVLMLDGSNKDRQIILAKNKLKLLTDDYRVVAEYEAKDLAGKQYKALIPGMLEWWEKQQSTDTDMVSQKKLNAFKVVIADFVNFEEDSDGTGIVHTGTPFGEEDLDLINKLNLPLILNVELSGKIIYSPVASGKLVKSAEEDIINYLNERGNVFIAERIVHQYPFCWRCDTALLYYSIDTWFIAITSIKDKILETNQQINWVPEHIKNGRMGNGLESAPDYAVSRNRFWGTPIPIWYASETNEYVCVGSLEELRELAVDSDIPSDIHRPYIDDVKLKTPSGAIATRIEEVFDCWFESGSMPYGQIHYPFSTTDEDRLQADFIVEGQDQTRGWFYTLHCIATAVFGRPAFKNCVVNGMINAADGRKLSKRLKNYTDPKELIEKYGADSIRFYLLSSNATKAESLAFKDESVVSSYRNVISTLINAVSFLLTYAEVDKWSPESFSFDSLDVNNELDRWIISRVKQVGIHINSSMDNYQIADSLRPVVQLLDDLSNWYIRRSRRRFWKSDNDSDKLEAYACLYSVILQICILLAPFIPFVTEYIYRELTADLGVLQPSIHLLDYPDFELVPEDIKCIETMSNLRVLVEDGLAKRNQAGIKLRQPLNLARYGSSNRFSEQLENLLREELNVLDIEYSKELDCIELDLELTPALKSIGLAKELIRHIQSHRKVADLAVDTRIKLTVIIDNTEWVESLEEHKALISNETLAESIIIKAEDSENRVVDNKYVYDSKIKFLGEENTLQIAFSPVNN